MIDVKFKEGDIVGYDDLLKYLPYNLIKKLEKASALIRVVTDKRTRPVKFKVANFDMILAEIMNFQEKGKVKNKKKRKIYDSVSYILCNIYNLKKVNKVETADVHEVEKIIEAFIKDAKSSGQKVCVIPVDSYRVSQYDIRIEKDPEMLHLVLALAEKYGVEIEVDEAFNNLLT